jgi:hypothetical protein
VLGYWVRVRGTKEYRGQGREGGEGERERERERKRIEGQGGREESERRFKYFRKLTKPLIKRSPSGHALVQQHC